MIFFLPATITGFTRHPHLESGSGVFFGFSSNLFGFTFSIVSSKLSSLLSLDSGSEFEFVSMFFS